MKFVDEVTIQVEGGRGGDGSASFRHEKFIPRGGPDGGDGGDGGSVFLLADSQLSTLLDLRHAPHQKGEHGVNGRNKQMYGRRGKDLIIHVPRGTIVFDAETGENMGEVVKNGERLLVAKGGRGGRGNMHFRSPTNQAPRRSEPGRKGERRTLRLELKLLADVGLVGFPNAGKSTLIAAVSEARPKIADYPFTTLIPNLGVARARSGHSFVIADIPGLIEGASAGAGLGVQFLRHVERCSVLLHVLEFNAERGDDPLADFHALRKELAAYAPDMLAKPQIAALNKSDIGHDPAEVKKLKRTFDGLGLPFFVISAVAHHGLEELLDALDRRIIRPETPLPDVML